MRELNLGSVLRPTSGNLKCIPNSSVSDNKGIINEKKNNRLQNKKSQIVVPLNFISHLVSQKHFLLPFITRCPKLPNLIPAH